MVKVIYLYEDQNYKNFLPLVYFRALFELYCGCLELKSKIQYLYPNNELGFLVRPALLMWLKEKYPKTLVNQFNNYSQPVLFISARAILKEKIIPQNKEELFVNQNNQLIGFYVQPERIKKFPINETTVLNWPIAKRTVNALKINYLWELIEHNSTEIVSDFALLKSTTYNNLNLMMSNVNGKLSPHAIVIGNLKNLYLGTDAEVEANVILDLRTGPVYIDNSVQIRGFSRIAGPAYIGKHTILENAYLSGGVSIGPECRISGEVEASIFQGYTNKHHYGFIGHAYIGEWVNLGAGTTNSDLKNNYSTVKVKLTHKQVDTELLKVGCFIGDHTKTAIGTLIGTGTVIGVFCNITEPALKSKHFKNFYWAKNKRWQLDKAITTAQVMMARRGVIMSLAYKDLIKKIYYQKTT